MQFKDFSDPAPAQQPPQPTDGGLTAAILGAGAGFAVSGPTGAAIGGILGYMAGKAGQQPVQVTPQMRADASAITAGSGASATQLTAAFVSKYGADAAKALLPNSVLSAVGLAPSAPAAVYDPLTSITGSAAATDATDAAAAAYDPLTSIAPEAAATEASSAAAPAGTAVAGAGVVASVLAPLAVVVAVPVIGATVLHALGFDQGNINDFDPWLRPASNFFDNQGGPLGHAYIAGLIWKDVQTYDPTTGRFLFPDGTVRVVKSGYTDKTGYVTSAAEREKLRIWKLRRQAAIRFSFNRSKVGPDGYTPLPQFAGFADSPSLMPWVLGGVAAFVGYKMLRKK